ncbi:hypothetical protein [Methylobacterium planeticum]|uniref:Uncharacterized protein n=1 Tax=Methylobacterium planeticum TaxID=2615211 RepID=A0A6N6MU80_9HYPH|nr:hypothetical protein [Methylobacterium planeticum]KAB1074278.1 hypothetical protein F6X51_07795 [Methylobacterium planeticum]
MTRTALLAAGLTVMLGIPASAGPKADPGTPSANSNGSAEAKRRDMEQRSQKAEKDQQARNQLFDAKVKRATGSVCSGC